VTRIAITSNAAEVAKLLKDVSPGVERAMNRTTQQYGSLLRTRVRARASGRPGPRVVTGDYRRSIGLQMTRERGAYTAVVGTNSVQGRRLEFGFVGADSLGRNYAQAPLPHFQPALDETAPQFATALDTAVAKATAAALRGQGDGRRARRGPTGG
jgi:hypothetical protein